MFLICKNGENIWSQPVITGHGPKQASNHNPDQASYRESIVNSVLGRSPDL